MREIKFRAWDGVDYMSTPFTLYDHQDQKIQFTKDAILMQYTGLKDKNGKEIYEGDLVNHGRLDTTPLEVRIGGYWPTEGDCGWGVHVCNEKETFVEGVSAFNQDNNLEVIGNIYENPELLTNE